MGLVIIFGVNVIGTEEGVLFTGDGLSGDVNGFIKGTTIAY